MKKLIFFTLLSFFSRVSEAQDPVLYAGNSKIILYSKKVISPIRLSKLDSVRTEYVYSGNLTEVLTGDISKIVTLNYEITFEKPFAIKKEYFDLIILSNNDTIRGFITDIATTSITYLPPGGEKLKKTLYKSYLLNNSNEKKSFWQKIFCCFC